MECSQSRRWVAHGSLAGVLAMLLVLRCFPPADAHLYPLCPVHLYLHVLCPGCGGTRAIAALLQGRIAEAWRFNTLIVATLPLTLGFFAVSYRRALQARRFAWPRLGSPALAACLVVTCAFTIVRNL